MCGKVLHIDLHLKIETNEDKEVEVDVPLSFDNNGIRSTKTDDGKEVQIEVQVTWYPEVKMMSGLDVNLM
ncbi:unnamed protein product [Urochloa humidicola]